MSRLQAKHIPDAMVVRFAAAWYDRAREVRPGVYLDNRVLPVVEALIACGIPEKLAWYKVERMTDKGLLEYGVGPRCAWPTPKGLELI